MHCTSLSTLDAAHILYKVPLKSLYRYHIRKRCVSVAHVPKASNCRWCGPSYLCRALATHHAICGLPSVVQETSHTSCYQQVWREVWVAAAPVPFLPCRSMRSYICYVGIVTSYNKMIVLTSTVT